MTIRDRVKKLIRVKASDLKPNPRNWRTHPAGQKRAMAAALNEIGFADAVLAREVDGGLELIDGHLRRETAAGESVPVLVLDVTADEADKLLATLDPLASMATTDAGKLSDLLSHVTISDKDLQQVANETAEAAGIGGDEIADGLTDPDEVPDAPEPITKPGDLWLMGDHRVLCGDCTKDTPADWRARVCITDPPYGVGLEYANHDDSEGASYRALLDKSIAAMRIVSPLLLMTIGHKHNNAFVHTHQPSGWLVWFDKMKQSPSGHAHLLKTELVYILGKVHTRYAWDILEIQSVRGDGLRDLHPCPKPVQLWAELIEPQTDKADIVFDPFLGSGTTLIAAEQLGRKCYGLEISPQYCDVIVKRWENFTGNVAERVSAGTEAVANG